MLFFYIRHGDPIYSPDSLTPFGRRQAEAVGKRLARYGLDEIYVSSSERAKQTAQPTCEILKMEPTVLDWTNEGHAWRDFSVDDKWFFTVPELADILNSDEARRLGEEWYRIPKLAQFEAGIERIRNESDNFFASLGYRHDRERHLYLSEAPSEKRIALFAHQGFGVFFLSTLLDVPAPFFINHFDICHSSVTVINFRDRDGIVIPQTLSLSNDSHIYAEGLPTRYNNVIPI